MSQICLLFRSYAKTEEGVVEVVRRAIKSAQHVAGVADMCALPALMPAFLVPSDHDSGKTARALRYTFDNEGISAIVLEEKGSANARALTAGIETLADMGYTDVIIISNKAVEFLTADVLVKIGELDRGGFNPISVRIPEIDAVSCVSVSNTFCFWNIAQLRRVGGFVTDTGVEEIIPLVKMIKELGVKPAVIEVGVSISLDIRMSADGIMHHKGVKDSKTERQEKQLDIAGVTAEWLRTKITDVQL